MLVTIDAKLIDGLVLAKENALNHKNLTPLVAAVEAIRVVAQEQVDKAVNDEEAIHQILAVVKSGTLHEDDLQEFLDDEVHNIASIEGSNTNNDGQEEQVRYLVAELGGNEVKRMLSSTFPEGAFNWD